MSLYNDMRPYILDEIMGQDKIVKVLKKDLSGGKIPNAMLFTGTRGVGKTSIARIVARTINCTHSTSDGNCCNECDSCKQILSGNSFDVLELDAASHNSVEDIRELLGMVQYKAIGRYKVFIIDEVHMLSTAAFNCLLKTLEEPPANVVFILCTTEAHKIPATILSRCRKYEFERINRQIIVDKLIKINSIYGLTAEENALHIVAKMAKGSMRDAESIYEHFLEVKEPITSEMVRNLLGVTSEEAVFSILQSVSEKKPSLATLTIKETSDKGASLAFLIEECFRVLMDIVSFKMSGDADAIVDSDDYKENIIRFSYELSDELCFSIMDALREAYMQKNANLEFAFEAAIISVFHKSSLLQQLSERVAVLEKKLSNYAPDQLYSAPGSMLPVSETVEENLSEPQEIEEEVNVMSANTILPTDTATFASQESSCLSKSEISSFDEDNGISFDELMANLEDVPDEFLDSAPESSVTQVPTNGNGTMDIAKSSVSASSKESPRAFDDFLSGAGDCARQDQFGFGWN